MTDTEKLNLIHKIVNDASVFPPSTEDAVGYYGEALNIIGLIAEHEEDGGDD